MSTDPSGTASAPEPAPAAAFTPPAPAERPVTETRPEILLGAAALGGFVLAKIVGRLRG